MQAKKPANNEGFLQEGPHFADDPAQAGAPAWEEIDVGRYMPRRIRGSCKGRALG
jgi:hypothetical protein